MTEVVMNPTPWMISNSCDIHSPNQPISQTGVDSLLSLQQYIKICGISYHVSAVIFGNNTHFCSIASDPIPGGDVNILYDGIKRHNRLTTFVPFKGFFKKIMGAEYGVTAIWYVKQKSCTVTEFG